MPTVVPLEDLDLQAGVQVGRKAATLGLLKRAGFRVPDGRVLDTDWFAAWQGGELDEEALRRAVREALADLGPGPFAVRSSGVNEDGGGHSMAGCFRTTLGVEDADRAFEAVLQCFDSVRRARTELQLDAGGMAALVQRQVTPDAAGVAFTADPVTGERDVVCIEAVAGLGDQLMDGAVDGERWRVRDGEVEGAGSALTAEQALLVARTAREVADQLGVPCDVEWALAGGDLAILQARPITALPAAPVPITEPDPPGFWLRDDHMPFATPLTRAVWFRHFPEHMARAYQLALPVEAVEFRRIRGQNHFRIVMSGGDGPPPPGPVLWLASRVLPSLRAAEAKARRTFEDKVYMDFLDRWDEEWAPELEVRARALLAVDPGALSDAVLLEHLEVCYALVRDGGEIHAPLGATHVIAQGRLLVFLEDHLGLHDGVLQDLLAGFSPGTTEADAQLAEIVRPWAEDPRLHEGTFADVLEALPELADALEEWLSWQGLRRVDYEIASPTLAESPELLLRRMRAAPQTMERLQRVRQQARERSQALLASAREQMTDAQYAELQELLEDARRGAHNRDHNALLTNQIPWTLVRRGVLELGRRLVERGRLEAPDHVFYVLPEEWEPALSGTAEGLAADVQRRRGERSWALAHPSPPTLGEPPAKPDPSWFPPNLRLAMRVVSRFEDPPVDPTADHVAGLAGGGGVVEGTARVLRTPDELHRLGPGDVLVCECTGPAWAPAYGIISAVVTDRGGILSHPAILAREYGLPAVLGTANGTHRIQDGDRVRVDGGAGTVEVL